jgi:chromosome partitioning protein
MYAMAEALCERVPELMTARSTELTHYIAIGNQKGGVAKTTTCLSLGACLAEMGKTVLLIDLDPQANLTMSLGFDPKTLRRTVSNVVLRNAPIVSASIETDVMGLDLVPANAGLAAVDKALYRCKKYELYLKEATAGLNGGLYDYVLMDCGPSFGPLTLNALTVADLMIIPTQAEYYASRSLEHVFRLIELVRQKTNPALRYRILVTMYDRRNRICVRTLEQMREVFSHVLFETVIGIDTKLRESPVLGVPITHHRPNTRGARQYRTLAEEVIGRVR